MYSWCRKIISSTGISKVTRLFCNLTWQNSLTGKLTKRSTRPFLFLSDPIVIQKRTFVDIYVKQEIIYIDLWTCQGVWRKDMAKCENQGEIHYN